MADVATNGVEDQGPELTMDDPLEDVQAVTNFQEPTKNAINSSDIIQGYNGFEKPVNGGSYSDDLLSLNSQPREPEVLSPEQTDPYGEQIAAVKAGEPASPGEGILIDFGGAAGNREVEPSAEPSNNPFLMEEQVAVESKPSEEPDPSLPAQYGGGDIMQASFFGDSSELANLNPFDSANVTNDDVNNDLSPAADTNLFYAGGEQENIEVCPAVDNNPIESSVDGENVEVVPTQDTNPFVQDDIMVAEKVEEAESQPEVENTNPFEVNHVNQPSEQNGSPEQESEGSIGPAEPADEKIENDYVTEEYNTTAGSSVDLPIVDNVPIDSIVPEDETEDNTEPMDQSDIRDEEIIAPVTSEPVSKTEPQEEVPAPVEKETAPASPAKEAKEAKPTKIASPGPKKPATDKDSKAKPSPTANKTQKKSAVLQKSSSVPVRTPTPQRPPLTRSPQTSGQTTPRKPTETKQVQPIFSNFRGIFQFRSLRNNNNKKECRT